MALEAVQEASGIRHKAQKTHTLLLLIPSPAAASVALPHPTLPPPVVAIILKRCPQRPLSSPPTTAAPQCPQPLLGIIIRHRHHHHYQCRCPNIMPRDAFWRGAAFETIINAVVIVIVGMRRHGHCRHRHPNGGQTPDPPPPPNNEGKEGGGEEEEEEEEGASTAFALSTIIAIGLPLRQ